MLGTCTSLPRESSGRVMRPPVSRCPATIAFEQSLPATMFRDCLLP